VRLKCRQCSRPCELQARSASLRSQLDHFQRAAGGWYRRRALQTRCVCLVCAIRPCPRSQFIADRLSLAIRCLEANCSHPIHSIMKKAQVIMAYLTAATSVSAQQQYYSSSYYASPGAAPVVVPPTVITTNAPAPMEHNSSKKSCKESMVDLFLFSVRRTTGDCTP